MRPDERYPLTWPNGWPRTPEWKRLESAQHKQLRKEFKEAVAEAVCMVHRLSLDRLSDLGTPHGLSAKQVKKQLMQTARTRPRTAIAALQREATP